LTRPFIQNINTVHKELWEKSDDRGRISPDEIKNTIKTDIGYTVVDKYWDELHNLNRVEQIPDTQTWLVKQPEEAGIDIRKDGEKKLKQVMIPEDVLQASEQYGVNFSAVMTEALIDEISSKKQFITDYLGEEYSEEETEYIFEMLKEELYSKRGDQREMARRGKRRRQIYQRIFDKAVTQDERQQIENLRQKSFELQEMLDL